MADLPQRLGKYHILERIAQGGMAEVYKAKSVGIAGFEKILAVKRIRPRYAKEQRFIRNFVDEARIAVTLNHRNIVQVFDFGKDEGELFLAMELLEGVDLRMAVKAAKAKGERLPAALSCYILADAASGLDYAHRKTDSEGSNLGIVHCDVSPHNILLSHEGFVKILDFGVARAKFVAAPTSRRLRGKPRYMAPEQTRGDTPSFHSDVFVLGILAWELLTGQQLFDGTDLKDILRKVRELPIPPLHDLRPDLPSYLCDAVMRALDRDVQGRGSAADIGRQLARAGKELSAATSAQALSDWLLATFGPRELPKEPTQTQVELKPPPVPREDEPTALVRPAVTLEESIDADGSEAEEDSKTPSGGTDATGDGFEEPTLATLIDKRRVVIAILMLSGGLDDRRRELNRVLADLAYKRGAVVHFRSDDELVAIFGLEVAGEDDVANAMHFAIDANELARNTSGARDAAPAVNLRTAARAGVVAQRKADTYKLRGDALNEARELARSAEPGRPLLSGGTGRLSSALFRFREMPAHRYRSRRLRVLELIGPVGHDDRTRALRDRRGRFVGREQELDTLWATYQEALLEKSHRGVLITGASGVGKSRLLSEFVACLDEAESPPLLIACAATEHTSRPPFSLAVDYLQSALQLAPTRGEHARAELIQRLARTLRKSRLSESEQRDACHDIELAMELRDGAVSGEDVSSVAIRERCAHVLAHFHGALVQGRPSVLILEDFHHADDASVELVSSLLQGTEGGLPVLLLVSSRDGSRLSEIAPRLPSMRLTDLSEAEQELLIADRLVETYDENLARELGRRAGGNPFYIEELCRAIREVGWDATPANVRDTVVSRVDRLSPHTRAILQRAAVIGESFRARILEELIGSSASQALQELVDDGLLIRGDRADYEAEGGEFRFRQGLIQEVVYAAISASARRVTHARLGKILSLRDDVGKSEPPALVARHLELGGQYANAARYWAKAGRVAMAAFESRSAEASYNRALELIAKLGRSDRERQTALEADALFGRAHSFRLQGKLDEQGRDLEALRPLCRGTTSLEAKRLVEVGEWHLCAGRWSNAIDKAQTAKLAAQTSGEVLLEGEALRIIGEASEQLGRFDEAFEASGQALSIFEGVGAQGPEIRARLSMAKTHATRSHFAEARALYESIVAQESGPITESVERQARAALAMVLSYRGELDLARSQADKAVAIADSGPPGLRADSYAVQGAIFQQLGFAREAQEVFDRVRTLNRPARPSWTLGHPGLYESLSAALLGDFERAFSALKTTAQHAHRFHSPALGVRADLALAGIYLQRNEKSDAETAVQVAQGAAEGAEQAGLHGAQALAMSRQAEGLRRTGAIESALEASRAAVRILNRQRQIDGPEEEILYHQFLLLQDLESPEAQRALERAFRSFERKLNAIALPECRRSFASLPLHEALTRAADGGTFG